MNVDADEADAATTAAAAAARQRAREAAEAAEKAEREAAEADAAISKRLHAVSAAAGARADAAAAQARAVAAAEAAERAEAEARRRKEEEGERAAAAAARRRQVEEEEKESPGEAGGGRTEEAGAAASERRGRGEESCRSSRSNRGESEVRRAAAAAAAATKAAAAALPRPSVVASPAAAAWAERASAALAAARASAAPFLSDGSPATKARRRAVDRAITLAVQQISATSSQVDAKCQQLSELLNSLQPGQTGERSYGFLAFSARIVAQCECQVALSSPFAFPLAQVVAAVCSSSEGVGEIELLEVIMGRMHAASPLSVPCWIRSGAEGNQHERLGFRESAAGNGLESTDDFAARLRGYALFLGALVAAADAGRWRGNQHSSASAAAARARGWSFVASALNALPSNRLTAVVLDGFLDSGGHALYKAYGRQFLKLLAALDEFFLPGLEAKKRGGGCGRRRSSERRRCC